MRQTGKKILDSLNGADEALSPLHLDYKDGDNKLLKTLVSIHKSIRRHVKADEKIIFF